MTLYHDWNQLLQQNPRELKFSGEKARKQIEEEQGLNNLLFKLKSLNFLEVSQTPISVFPEHVGNLDNLTNLVLRDNKLASLPSGIGKLTKLKFIDVSNNNLESLHDTIGNLHELQSLLLSVNKLKNLPDSMKNLSNLTIIKIEYNQLDEFPEVLCNENLKTHLAEIHAKHNEIKNISKSISNLAALKVLDLTENKVTEVPGELGDCTKLKEISLKGNKLVDRKLLKLVDQGKMKQILDYIRINCLKSNDKNGHDGGKETFHEAKARMQEARRRRRSASRSSLEEREAMMETVNILGVKQGDHRLVVATPAILENRKIVCCIVRNVDFTRAGILKKFLALQTDIHDGLLCGKRKNATIATHDLDKISGNINFDQRPPSKIRLHPLGRHGEMSAAELYRALNDEAEAYRKEKKRNAYSGVHKYLLLLKGKQRYPCLTDSSGVVISFPPITNSENTKISDTTKNLFLEVTGENQPTCKKVMDALIHGMLKAEIGEPKTDDHGGLKPSHLDIEPVRVVDPEGKLYVVYPSKVDLLFDDMRVLREHNHE
ncbi:leucine-rich repeat-containing protein 47-like [Brevipalpus obovatus]|uniref:leucine-rich repeat-containing protein 47-like n=1 Tax=Brevipalpus obovatus TaxID=246614 RepID=UPI003D9DF42A